jgi:ADP-ribosylglycohydrolase
MCAPVPAEQHLKEELRALREEGFDVSQPETRLRGISGMDDDHARQERAMILAMLANLPRRSDFAHEEPSDLAAIRAARPQRPRKLSGKLGKQRLADRTLGGWLGRAAGCLLGKPCEGSHRTEIERRLRAIGCWPLNDYWPVVREVPEGISYPSASDPSLKENITRMTRDDDMDYPIVGLHILERFGPGFTTRDVGNVWLERLPYHCVYTAERVAYRNLVNEFPTAPASSHPERLVRRSLGEGGSEGSRLATTATFQNPYREWIGAQIRADIWGWAAPGNPELAAEFAWRDASLSHTKNGIYGEMFFAALLAAAFLESDLHQLIEIALSEIPRNCRLREAVLDTVAWCEQDSDWEATWERINERYGHYHGVHTINNAAVVLMGLLHSKGDYEKAISIAVMGGWDTDCNGATAGSVIGTLLGAKALPAKWIAPLHDRISSIVLGFTDMRISELARRTRAVQVTP